MILEGVLPFCFSKMSRIASVSFKMSSLACHSFRAFSLSAALGSVSCPSRSRARRESAEANPDDRRIAAHTAIMRVFIGRFLRASFDRLILPAVR
jgi:hypothetical protein